MTEHWRAVIVGGGIMGVSLAYYLGQLGWRETLLVEQAELTAGQTWHAAGNVPHHAETMLLGRLRAESLESYRRLQRETGQATGLKTTGSLKLATTPDQVDAWRRFCGMARNLGVPAQMVGPSEARDLFPPLETSGVLAALWTAGDGHVDPTQTTRAFAAGARQAGATIRTGCRVTGLAARTGGGWRIATTRGDIECDVLVNAAGLWAAEVAAMAGAAIPVCAVRHQYVVTGPIAEIAARDAALPALRDIDAPFYARQQGDGLLVSAYWDETRFWGEDGVPQGFAFQLLDDDLPAAKRTLDATARRIPCFAGAGIAEVICGPIVRTPDGHPLAGPLHGRPDHFVLAGEPAGFLHSSLARYVAQWIIDGDPGIDLTTLDPRRFGTGSGPAEAIAANRAGTHATTVRLLPPAGARDFRRPADVERLMAETRAARDGPVRCDDSGLSAMTVDGPRIPGLDPDLGGNTEQPLLSPAGRLVATVRLWRDPAGRVRALVPEDCRIAARDRLGRTGSGDGASLPESGSVVVVSSPNGDAGDLGMGGITDLGFGQPAGVVLRDGRVAGLPPARASDDPTPISRRALDSLRIEAGTPAWGREYGQSSHPRRAGLEEETADWLAGGPPARVPALACLALETGDDPRAPWPFGAEPVMDGPSTVGIVTSAGWSPLLGTVIVLAHLQPDTALLGTALEIELLGDRVPAQVIAPPAGRA